MPPQPGSDPLLLMRAVVVDYQMEVQFGQRLGIDLLKKPNFASRNVGRV